MSALPVVPAAGSPRFLDVVRQAGLERFGRAEAAQRWVEWARRYILFHNKRHPAQMGAADIGRLLAHVSQSGGSVSDVLNARVHLARKGVSGVASPFDLLGDVSAAEVRAAVGATHGLGGMRAVVPLPHNAPAVLQERTNAQLQ